MNAPTPNLITISRRIIQCEACPRLRAHCRMIAQEKRRAYLKDLYWGKPISGFGDPEARIVIIGLAPAAHGANRTGRIFTGDRSGDWLYRALHKAGFANQALSASRNDGLELTDVYVTCAVRCAPPDNRPTPEELHRCSTRFLRAELAALQDNAKVFIALGQIAFRALWPFLAPPSKSSSRGTTTRPAFGHGRVIPLENKRHLILSYHPSQQNTFTGRLTESMFDSIFNKAAKLLREQETPSR